MYVEVAEYSTMYGLTGGKGEVVGIGLIFALRIQEAFRFKHKGISPNDLRKVDAVVMNIHRCICGKHGKINQVFTDLHEGPCHYFILKPITHHIQTYAYNLCLVRQEMLIKVTYLWE